LVFSAQESQVKGRPWHEACVVEGSRCDGAAKNGSVRQFSGLVTVRSESPAVVLLARRDVLKLAGALAALGSRDASAKGELKLGVSLGLLGEHRSPSRMQRMAYEMWADETSAKGGVLGRPVQLIIEDNRSDTALAKRHYESFIAERFDHVFGPYSSEITAAIVPITERAGYPLLAAGASADAIWSQGHGHVFGMWTQASRYTQGMLRLLRDAGFRRVALIHAADNFALDIAAGVIKWAPFLNLELVLVRAFAGTSTPTFISQARQAGADLVMVAGHLDEALAVRRAVDDSGWYPPAFYATVGPALPDWPVLAGKLAERTFTTSIWEPNDSLSFPRSREFAANFLRRWRVEPSYHAATAYAAGQILENAIAAAGSADRAAVTRALFALDTYTVLGRFAVDRTGVQSKRIDMIVQWQGNRKQIVWPPEIRTAEPSFSRAG
jgi:branched-chain amino acid transport system substrate-binding protein